MYFRWQRWGALLAMGSLAVTIVVLILGAVGAFDFKAAFDGVAGAGGYEQVIADGMQREPCRPRHDLGATMNFVLWPAFSIWFAVAATAFSGEVKKSTTMLSAW